MKKGFITLGAVLCAVIMLECNDAAVAEERRLGDYIYVPAISEPGSVGTTSLRVTGSALTLQGEAVTIDSLSGAEFGVYVISSDGELTPWANPLYPSEPMRIRTGEEAVSFALPRGTEFYLRQESAPTGYTFDSQSIIPVTEGEIVVENRMAGQIVITTEDTLGEAIAGVTLEIVAQDGQVDTIVTDAAGQAVYYAMTQTAYLIREVSVPEGVYAAQSTSIGGFEMQGVEVTVTPALASRTKVRFEHPAAGTVQLEMRMDRINDHGQHEDMPLSDVTLSIQGDESVAIVTDAQGQGQASLKEGLYNVSLSYDGAQDVVLPIEQGQVLVASGETTLIELTAKQRTGRVVLTTQCDRATEGGSLTLEHEQTGDSYGPFALDAQGQAVSQALEPGEYRVIIEAPVDTQLEDAQEITVHVTGGEIAQVSARLLTRERQNYEIIMRSVDQDGAQIETGLGKDIPLTLIDDAGQETGDIRMQQGMALVEALDGTYALRMDERTARELGVVAQSEPFDLSAQGETVTFRSVKTRLILAAVDENDMPVPGGAYRVTDSDGASFEVLADESGMAVTPLLAAGDVRVETISAPQGHDAAAQTTVQASAGAASKVKLTHENYGTMDLTVYLQSLDERGSAVRTPMQGIAVKLYSVSEDGNRMTDMGIMLQSGEDGALRVALGEGEYVAQVVSDALGAGIGAPQALRFSVRNRQSAEGEMVCADAFGGVRVTLIGGELADAELAQVRFELSMGDGQTIDLTMQDGAFYAGGLAAGTYVLRQVQMPQGYTLAAERTVTVSGGTATQVSVPLEEYAMLSVQKTGLTFNDQLQTYVVPLTGEYGVFTMKNGQLAPYPSADSQVTVWSGVVGDQQERKSQVKLPATIEGITYYLMEIGSASGFAPDTQAHEVTLSAGQSQTVTCGVSSDRGFFALAVSDATTGAAVPGGEYELLDDSGETILTFEMGEEAYVNPMAVPVGRYILRQVAAAQNYALSDTPEIVVDVPPYMMPGGSVAQVAMTCLSLAVSEEMEGAIQALYTASEQGLTLVSAEGGVLRMGEALMAPQLEMSVRREDGGRLNIASVVLQGALGAQGEAYRARVEYCLVGGGWQPSRARYTGVLNAPTAVSLQDVEDDICAVRITYINGETGEELAGSGFTPGQATLNVQISGDEDVAVTASAGFGGTQAYRTTLDGQTQYMHRSGGQEIEFGARGNGVFETVSAGRDGRISGIAFFDNDADGVMSRDETGRYAGLSVSLMTRDGENVASVRTGADGSYAFESISSGVYVVQFGAGSDVVFSGGEIYTPHVTSGVVDMHYGGSALITIDGDHTDHVVNAGCIYAAGMSGSIVEVFANGKMDGVGGLTLEMVPMGAQEGEEPAVVLSDDMGVFSFSGIIPGEYEMRLYLPDGYLCDEAQDGRINRALHFDQGEEIDFGELVLCREAVIAGTVYIDDDGDGVIVEGSQTLPGVTVTLLRADEGHTQRVAQATTDENGAYRFDALQAGAYSVLFELEDEWVFTRYGEDSMVYGAVSQSGSTRTIPLDIGQTLTNVNAGVTIPAQFSVTVFKDTQVDGQKGVYEELFEGVTLSLIRIEDGEEAEEVSYKTDGEGTVVFTGVSPGEYVIAYQLPGQWRATRQVDASTTSYPVSCVPQSMMSSGRSEPITFSMGQSGLHLYIGAMLSGSISGTVYYDDDADAKQGEEEAYCPGVTVELLDSGAQVLMTQTSESDGSYSFEGLAPGRYSVRFTAQDECGFSGTDRTVARSGAQKTQDNVTTTRSIVVTGGQAISTADAGVVRLTSVSGSLWEDVNGDGIWDEGERALAGVSMHLMNGAGRNILDTVQTDAQGAYRFERLSPDSYKLRIDAPDGYVFSGAAQGGAIPLESQSGDRGYSVSFTLLGGAHAQGANFGLLTQGSISGRIWQDTDYNGHMDEGEEGLRGARVTLLAKDASEVASTQSLRDGTFAFDELMPGEYTLRVTLGDGYVFTVDRGDSLAPRQSETTAEIALGMLEMGGTMTDISVGTLQPASMGGIVWLDADDDGRRQSGDAGMAGVVVRLEVLTGTDEGMVYETTTDASGAYRFDGVMPGKVQLHYALKDGYAFARNANGTRRVSSVPRQDALEADTQAVTVNSGEDNLAIDVGVVGVGIISGRVWLDSTYDGMPGGDEHGVSGTQIELLSAVSGETLATATTDENGAYAIDFVRVGEYMLRVTLPEGMMFTKDGTGAVAMTDERTAMTERFALGMGESRVDMNAGAIRAAQISGRLTVDEDENGVCDAHEAGLSGAVITLMQGGTVVATTRTREDGAYSIEGLRPDEYRIRVTLPQSALFAPQASLERAYADAQEAEGDEFTLAMGESIAFDPVPTVLASRIAGCTWADDNADGRRDAGEQPLAGVTVELLGMKDGGKAVGTVTVGDDGAFEFSLLRTGEYAIRVTLPEGQLFADRIEENGASCITPVPGSVATTEIFELAMGQERLTMNVGAIRPGTIGDTVWLDRNGNGLQDYREPALSGVSLTLLRIDSDGAQTEQAGMQSDAYGYYRFTDLRPGTYRVRVNVEPGDTLTYCFGEPLGEIDSDIDPDTAMSADIVLMSGQTVRNIDVGFTEIGE